MDYPFYDKISWPNYLQFWKHANTNPWLVLEGLGA